MEYRKLPRGNDDEKFSVLGLGMGGIQGSSDEEIERVISTAIDNGINFFDLCGGGKNVYEPFGKAISGRRDKVFFSFISERSTIRTEITAGRGVLKKLKKLWSGS